MRERRHPIQDPEILELFQDQPELLAVVDAIAATQARRRAVSRRLLLAAAAMGAAIVLVAFVPFEFGDASLEDRALAAVGESRVVHLIVTRVEPERAIIDLDSGAETPGSVTQESWYDSENRDFRAVIRRERQTVADILARNGATETLDPVVAGFVRGYREALERGELEVLRRDRLDGHEIIWARLTLPGVQRGEIALDAETALPRAFRSVSVAGALGPLWRVETIESEPRSEGDFRPGEAPAGPSAGRVESERNVSPADATAILRGDARWSGSEVDGLAAAIRAQVLSRMFPDGREMRTSGVEVLYGDVRSDYIEIQQAIAPEPAYGFSEGRLTFDFAPIPASGKIAVTRLGPPGRAHWLGQLVDGEVYVSIRSSRRDLVLAAARSLAPLP